LIGFVKQSAFSYRYGCATQSPLARLAINQVLTSLSCH